MAAAANISNREVLDSEPVGGMGLHGASTGLGTRRAALFTDR